MKGSLVLLAVLPVLASASVQAHSPLEGEWKLQSMIYQGNSIPLPNPDLNLRFTFDSNGMERLHWDRGSAEFCERVASYSVENGFLQEEVLSVNPANAAECEKDPDMQVGRKTVTKIQVSHQEILLYFPLGEEELIYVLRLQSPGCDDLSLLAQPFELLCLNSLSNQLFPAK